MSGFGTPGGIRTPDLEIRSLPLYPAELRARETSSVRMSFGACAAKRYGTCDDVGCQWSGRRDSNPQQSAWKADALPIELRPQIGRADRIRTCDPLLPKQMRYQAALRPDTGARHPTSGLTSSQQCNDAPRAGQRRGRAAPHSCPARPRPRSAPAPARCARASPRLGRTCRRAATRPARRSGTSVKRRSARAATLPRTGSR